MRVTAVEDPKNINYHNFGSTGVKGRFCLAIFMIIGLMILFFLSVFGIGYLLKIDPANCDKERVWYDTVLTEPDTDFAKDSVNRECFCRYRDLVQNLKRYGDICFNSYVKNLFWMILLLCSGFFVFMSNQFFRAMIRKIATFIRFKTKVLNFFKKSTMKLIFMELLFF